MTTDERKIKITNTIADFINYMSKVLPDDVFSRLTALRDSETDPAALALYDTMFRNTRMAAELDRPLCQDTGIIQFWVKCGAHFPALNELEGILTDAVLKATKEAPLRPNCVETFDEVNTGTNIGNGAPVIWWDIIPDRDDCEICVYFSGGGCSLPGRAEVFMPGKGYQAIIPFVMDRVTEYGLNACPPLVIGIGVGMSVETAAMNSKKALMRRIGSKNSNPKAAQLEEILEESINAIGIGPQGLGGSRSVLGVNVVNTVRHPATLGVAVGFGCWCHRRGILVFDRDMECSVKTHAGFSVK